MIQATNQAVVETHRLLVAEKYFESTSSSLREISDNLTSAEEASLRRVYNSGIKRSVAAIKQIDECIKALEAHDAWELKKEKGNLGSSASTKEDTKNISSNSRKKSKTAPKVTSRPPHMDRIPAIEELVAAKAASHELWILGIVKSINEKKKNYQIKDADPDGRSYTLDLKNIRLLPTQTEIKSCRWIVPGLRVLAMYPETTVFYPATVKFESSKENGEDSCVVVFDDDENDEGIIPDTSVPKRFITLRD